MTILETILIAIIAFLAGLLGTLVAYMRVFKESINDLLEIRDKKVASKAGKESEK